MQPAEPWQIALVFGAFALCYLFIGFGQGWLMRAAQLTIFILVIASNAVWQWTPNGYLAAILAAMAAFALTAAPVTLLTRLRLRRQRLANRSLARQNPPDERRDLL
jgi:membrane protein implicated in regulation of membrane protease activity